MGWRYKDAKNCLISFFFLPQIKCIDLETRQTSNIMTKVTRAAKLWKRHSKCQERMDRWRLRISVRKQQHQIWKKNKKIKNSLQLLFFKNIDINDQSSGWGQELQCPGPVEATHAQIRLYVQARTQLCSWPSADDKSATLQLPEVNPHLGAVTCLPHPDLKRSNNTQSCWSNSSHHLLFNYFYLLWSISVLNTSPVFIKSVNSWNFLIKLCVLQDKSQIVSVDTHSIFKIICYIKPTTKLCPNQTTASQLAVGFIT